MQSSLLLITSAAEDKVQHPFSSQQASPLKPRFPYQMQALNHSFRNNQTLVKAGRALSTNLDGRHPMLCLERAIGERFGADKTLWETGAFDAQVYPDLPFASSWSELLEKLLGLGASLQKNPYSSTVAADVVTAAAAAGAGNNNSNNNSRTPLTVRTIGAQCHSREKLLAKMRLACKSSSEGGGDANALLFVSGSHPARSLPFTDSFLQSSFSLLRDASRLRAQGDLPASLALWAVENPINPPERLLKKVEAGAEVVLTQPPFIQNSAEKWFDSAEKNGIASEIKLLAGMPMSTSRSNLEFWLNLCGLGGTPAAAAVVASFPLNTGGDKEEYQQLVRNWNVNFVQWVSLQMRINAFCSTILQ
jgi:hypothetical protein